MGAVLPPSGLQVAWQRHSYRHHNLCGARRGKEKVLLQHHKIVTDQLVSTKAQLGDVSMHGCLELCDELGGLLGPT